MKETPMNKVVIAPKEKPILFSGAMVRAILDGSKTQTRRKVNLNWSARVELRGKQWHPQDENAKLGCPYGQPGDRLWVKETHALVWEFDTTRAGIMTPEFQKHQVEKGLLWYRANGEQKPIKCQSNSRGKWRPSIFMPRWASRLTLEIVSVRVERLQEICEDDAEAEGALSGFDDHPEPPSATAQYRRIWESINGPGSWAKNPYVWAIELKCL